jgi:hypothetical protein
MMMPLDCHDAITIATAPQAHSIDTVLEAHRCIARCPEQVLNELIQPLIPAQRVFLVHFCKGLQLEAKGEFQSAKMSFTIAESHSAPNDWQAFYHMSKCTMRNGSDKNRILIYYEGLHHPQEPYAGTSAILFELSRTINARTDDFHVDMMGDGIGMKTACRGVQFLPTPQKEKLQECLRNYDVVLFASHIRNFRHCAKPATQVWLLYQHCWEIETQELEQIHLFDAVIGLSHLHKQAMVDQGISPETIEIFPNAIDTQFFRPVPTVARKPHSIMFAGAVVPYKRLDLLLAAFNRTLDKYPDATLDIYGSADLWHVGNEYERELYHLNSPSARYHGAVQNAQMPEIYSRHSVLCLPSTLESFSLVCIEAQACGCIVIAHNAGGVSVTVPDAGTGYLYAPNTTANLSGAIDQAFVRLDTDPDIRRRCRQYVCDTYDMDKNLPKFIGILKRRIRQNRALKTEYAMTR